MGSSTTTSRSSRGHRSSRKKQHFCTHFGHRNYSRYISRVLKEVVPHSSISSRTMDVMSTLINDIFELISIEACNVMHYRKRCTLTPEDIQKAVYLLLPEKLATHAVAFGNEAVHRYTHS